MWVTESGKKKHFPLIIVLFTVMSSSVLLIDEYFSSYADKNGKKHQSCSCVSCALIQVFWSHGIALSEYLQNAPSRVSYY